MKSSALQTRKILVIDALLSIVWFPLLFFLVQSFPVEYVSFAAYSVMAIYSNWMRMNRLRGFKYSIFFLTMLLLSLVFFGFVVFIQAQIFSKFGFFVATAAFFIYMYLLGLYGIMSISSVEEKNKKEIEYTEKIKNYLLLAIGIIEVLTILI